MGTEDGGQKMVGHHILMGENMHCVVLPKVTWQTGNDSSFWERQKNLGGAMREISVFTLYTLIVT
jgi:hypothetical protein